MLGDVGLYSELCVIAMDFLSGPIMDIFGRKYPITIGILVAGVFMYLIPHFKEVYPGFLICRIMIGISTILFVNVPLVPDYV